MHPLRLKSYFPWLPAVSGIAWLDPLSRRGHDFWSNVIVGQRGGQLAVGFGLGEQCVSLGLKCLHGVCAGSKTNWRFLERNELHERVSELCGVATLLPIHALPGSDNLLGLRGVIVNGGLGIRGRVIAEQLGAEETGLDQHRANSEGGDLWRE